MVVAISFISQTLLRIISMVLSSDIFAKSDVTSNKTILYPRGTFIFLICLANVFVLLMVYPEVPNGDNNLAIYFAVLTLWKRYVDDTITFVKTDEIKNVLSSFNSYYSNIQFTMEIEQNSQIPFLDVL